MSEQPRVEVSVSSLKVLYFLGISPRSDRSTINYWIRYVWFVIEIVLLYPMVSTIQSLLFVVSLMKPLSILQGYPLLLSNGDIKKVTNILILFLAIASGVSRTFFFVRGREKVLHLVQELQFVVDTSKCQYDGKSTVASTFA